MAEALEILRAVLADRYRVERELGSGGMATVYLAEDLKHHRRVAIKVLRPDLAAVLGPERFLREIEIAAGLTHPHVLPLHDSGKAGGFLYYVMPYVEGESLRVRITREGELPIPLVIRIVRDVADALAAAHKHGVVHRDIKPDNVLLLDNHAVVTDFGVARAVSEATGRHQLTTAGVALGTPAYMAPEQAVADPHVDHRADIYALGVMGYEMLTGRPPFSGSTAQAVLAAHVTETPEPVTARRPTVPPVLAELVMRCLAKKPADRWQTAEELLHTLEGITTPTGGVTPTAMQPAIRSLRRRWAAVGLGVAAAVAIVVPGFRWITRWKGPALSLDKVLVVPLENATGDPALDGIGTLVEAQLVEGLQSTGLAEILSSRTALLSARMRDTTRQHIASAAGGRQLAQATGSGVLYTGRYLAVGDSVQVELSIVDLTDLTEPARIPVVVVPRAPTREALEPLRERAMGALAILLDPRQGVRYIPGLQAPTYTAYREYYVGADAMAKTEYLEAFAHFRRALAADSTFLVAAVRAGYALYNNAVNNTEDEQLAAVDSFVAALRPRRAALGEHEAAYLARLEAWIRGDQEEMFRQSETMARVAPKFPFAAYVAARQRLFVNRPRSAAAGLAALDLSPQTEVPPDYVLRDLANALHLIGDHEEELGVTQRWAGHPRGAAQPLGQKRSELVALVALGRIDEVRSRLDELLTARTAEPHAMNLARELSWHGHRDLAREVARRALRGLMGREVLFTAYVLSDSLGGARSLADSLERSTPGGWQTEAFRGVVAALQGNRDRAAEALTALAAVRERYTRGRPELWMARIRAISGEKDEAVRLLREAYSEGRDFFNSFHADPFLEPLRDHPGFQEFMRPKG